MFVCMWAPIKLSCSAYVAEIYEVQRQVVVEQKNIVCWGRMSSGGFKHHLRSVNMSIFRRRRRRGAAPL